MFGHTASTPNRFSEHISPIQDRHGTVRHMIQEQRTRIHLSARPEPWSPRMTKVDRTLVPCRRSFQAACSDYFSLASPTFPCRRVGITVLLPRSSDSVLSLVSMYV